MEKSLPKTAKELLKLRYQAFVDGNVDYILDTHHPETRDQVDRASVEAWSKGSKWLGLEIEDEKIDGDKTHLTFTVRYEKDFETINHREFAEFRKNDGRWFYFDSEFPKAQSFRREGEKVGRNDPCACGSGQKFKKCCAVRA
jgi:SEC-C motif-containing protein